MLQSGQTLAHFRVINRLGIGGMGEVYLAEDTKLGRKVALKIMQADFFEDQERRERFYREAKSAAGISHPNIMAIHDIGSAADPSTGQDIDFIVMEYIDGTPLSEQIPTMGQDIKTVIRLAEQIAAGLAAAHKVHIVHRDIKAENVMIDADGSPKILDFGLAKAVAPYKTTGDGKTESITQELTKAGTIVGTVTYMSPEQIRGETVDSRSDVFSFGILLYRMATGIPPFEGKTQVSTLARILESQPEPPHARNDQVPPELERIIDKCLQKDPNDRYQDTRDLVVDLRNLRRQYDSGVSTLTSGVSEAARSAVGRKRRRWLVPVGVAAVILIVAGAVWQIRFRSTSSSQAAGGDALAILGFENKTGEDSLNWLQTGLPEILWTDLSQSQTLPIIGRDRIVDRIEGRDETGHAQHTHAQYLEAARALGVRHALSGAYYRISKDYRIDARLEDISSGRIVLTEKVQGNNWFAMVDSLTEKIARSLNMETESTSAASVSTYTSSSPDAYKKYVLGMGKFEKELYDEAIAEFKEAIAYDSTFALPYMRIGMAHVFQGRQQEGARWLSLARQHQSHLPKWEAKLLEVYANLWFDRKFDSAFVNMATLVKNHPNDKESRFIYALMIQTFTQDTAAAFAQLDTALQLDPKFLFALTDYANLHAARGDFAAASDYALKARKYHPDSPTPYLLLGRLYTNQDQLDRAAGELQEMLKKFPGDADALERLSTIYIHNRDFAAARRYIDQSAQYHGDDPYVMVSYYDNLANLAIWAGEFRTALILRNKGLRQILITNDSTLISATYATIARYCQDVGMTDSSMYYSHLGDKWATLFQKINYPIQLVAISPANADSARPRFEEAVAEFRSRIPSEIWPLADRLRDAFEAYAKADTTALLAVFEKINEINPGADESNQVQMGYWAVQIGQFERARQLLAKYVSGTYRTASGFDYPMINYYLGLAEEGLGNAAQAAVHYREMLTYWGKPEIELREIRDARQRLARLTS